MTAFACALALGFTLSYLAWRDWLRLQTPLAPHEDLKREVEKLRADMDACRVALGVERLEQRR